MPRSGNAHAEAPRNAATKTLKPGLCLNIDPASLQDLLSEPTPRHFAQDKMVARSQKVHVKASAAAEHFAPGKKASLEV